MNDDLPLAGIKVLDLSRVLAGPLSGMVLGDLGADVVKVEHPERGDDTRDWGLRVSESGTTYFNSVNRNKRSLGLDLQSSAGQAVARDLACDSDVLIQNFKTGGAERLGLGYEALKALNPGLIYCSIGGYDAHGPEAGRPGYDLVIQGESGLMAMNGEAGQGPLKLGVAVVDLFTGMSAAQAILAALVQRGRTGLGRHIQLSLYDSGLTLTSYYGLEALQKGEDPPKYGNSHPSIVPYGVFEAADGPLVITIGNNAQFARFCRDAIGRPDLAEDPRFATNLQRSINRAELLSILAAELKARNRSDLLTALAQAGIPCGEVLGLTEALTSQRTGAAGMVQAFPHFKAGLTHVLAPPWRFDGERLPIRTPPPALGEHSREILATRLDRGKDEIAGLENDGGSHGYSRSRD
ncbi:CoA transferase [Bosea sp. ASV33]|uniref:CaiB/BaiF CoA transferase family protein n=1 Tax=Bosea sp. ASV33 TaxID=2795106 RepID=UPI0018EABDE2|nr:CoA transferase [Bosea sp. ASV33]